jgi:hypothetical protein
MWIYNETFHYEYIKFTPTSKIKDLSKLFENRGEKRYKSYSNIINFTLKQVSKSHIKK